MKTLMTLDEAIRPHKMTCINCEGEMIVYPCPIPEGTGFCATCSPAWLESFAKHLMNVERQERGLNPID